jgi:UPF0271 protein
MKVVLDTSAIIYLNDFRSFDKIFTTQGVIREIKDKISSLKLAGIDLKVVEPSIKKINQVKNVARKTGDLEKLSQTDVEILALAKEMNAVIISDDRNIQNVAEKMNLKYISIFSKRISKLITWRKFCKICKKFYKKGRVCEICGSKLIRVPKKTIEIKEV